MEFITWILAYVAMILPGLHCQSLTSTLSDEQTYCLGENITFTCETMGSSVIAWRSEDYIEVGGTQLAFGTFNGVGDTQTSPINSATIAILTVNDVVDGVQVLKSELRITPLSKFSTSSVTCVHVSSGVTNTSSFQAVAVPEMPQHLIADQRMYAPDICILHLIWNNPRNIHVNDIRHVMIHINGTIRANKTISENRTIAAYSLCSCASNDLTITAVNRCGHTSENTPNIELITISLSDSVCTTGGATTSSRCECNLGLTITASILLPVTTLIILILIVVIIIKWLKKSNAINII